MSTDNQVALAFFLTYKPQILDYYTPAERFLECLYINALGVQNKYQEIKQFLHNIFSPLSTPTEMCLSPIILDFEVSHPKYNLFGNASSRSQCGCALFTFLHLWPA